MPQAMRVVVLSSLAINKQLAKPLFIQVQALPHKRENTAKLEK